MKRFSTIVLTVCIYALFIGLGCKKVTEQEKMPYNEIESFVLAGYSGQSINASVNNGEIIVYWASEAKMPATIKPVIEVSKGASISPASGTEVAFTSNTVYTVKAEDGTEKTYRLKPVSNIPVPRIATISPTTSMVWISSSLLTVTGEYFLTGDTSSVKVYAERMKDGFEFDLTLDYSKISMTNISARLPLMNDIMDTGMHRMRVKIGNRISDYQEVNLRFPDITYTNMANMTWVEAGKTLQAGDSMTLKIWDNYNGQITKWYMKKFLKVVIEDYVFDASQLTQTDSTIKFKLPATPIKQKPSNVIIYYIGPFGSQTYWAKILPQSSWPIIPVKI